MQYLHGFEVKNVWFLYAVEFAEMLDEPSLLLCVVATSELETKLSARFSMSEAR